MKEPPRSGWSVATGFLFPESRDTVEKDADSPTLTLPVDQRIRDVQEAAERILEQAAS